MRILAISAHYPPCHFGGYEIRVKAILDGLAAHGHTIRVLTNYPEIKATHRSSPESYPAIRRLHNRTKARFFLKEVLYDLLDTRLLEKQIEEFKPDVIYLGHTYIFSKALLPYLARQNIPIVYDEGGSGLIEAWTEHGRWFRFTGNYRSRFASLNWIKPFVIRLVVAISRGRIQREWTWPQNMRIIFNSELNRKNAQAAGVPIDNSTVIHSGVDTSVFTFKLREKMGSPLRIIVPGRIERRKGQLDAVHLVKALLDEGIDTRLVMAGSGWVDGYYEEVLTSIRENQLTDHISILPMLTAEELAAHYHNADICFFPSHFRTGFSRVPLEAMACGCLVISYGNEGSDEIIKDRETGFLVEERAYTRMMQIIRKLVKNPYEVERITQAVGKEIEEKYSLEHYSAKIESELSTLVNR